MTNTVIKSFRISGDDLSTIRGAREAYGVYTAKRIDFADALVALNKEIGKLQDLLGEPLRAANLIPADKDWKLKDNPEDTGLIIEVLAEPRKRGRKKPEVPLERL